jgi:MYXO-CTERM domain-containing protein
VAVQFNIDQIDAAFPCGNYKCPAAFIFHFPVTEKKTMNEKLRIAALAGVLLAGSVGGALAQTEAPATDTTVAVTPVEADNDDDGFDLGWLGLIGLAGLAGLSGRRNRVHHHTTAGTGTTGTTRI